MIARLYGLNVTPGVVYNAMPWSWLIDWFSNVGDNIENLDHGVADRLLADYAYLMGEQRDYIKYSAAQAYNGRDGATLVANSTATWGISHKRRYVASPFGFGLTEDDLTPNQAGILLSLAGSR